MTGERLCRWCRDMPTIHRLVVVVGPPPGREVKLFVDAEPHPDGDVVQLDDGSWRQLGPKDDRHRPTYRVHGETICGPGAAPKRYLARQTKKAAS